MFYCLQNVVGKHFVWLPWRKQKKRKQGPQSREFDPLGLARKKEGGLGKKPNKNHVIML